MKLVVLPKSETPLYIQLHDQIVSQIVTNTIAENECLPSIRFVARELQISVIPVKSAYELLEQEGYIYTIPGKGCFVSQVNDQHKLVLAKEKLQDSIGYCKNLGLDEKEILEIVKNCCKNED